MGAYETSDGMISAGETVRVSVSSMGVQANDRSDFAHSSISADGRYTVFDSYATNLVSGDTNGTNDIFVRDIQTGLTTRASVDSSGMQADGISTYPSISADGRYVVFESPATNLVPGDTNGTYDVFVRDLQTSTTTRISIDSLGAQANGGSFAASISADGRYIAFASEATNLVPSGDTNMRADIFLHDIQTGATTRVSIDSNGLQANGRSINPTVSGDGRFVVFSSGASNLVPNDSNGIDDIFLHDMQTGVTTRPSIASNGVQGNSFSEQPSVSVDGRYVVFISRATNLVPGDTNAADDIFVHDTQTGMTTRVSVASNGAQGNGGSENPFISTNGRYITFSSFATNLVPQDTNLVSDVFVRDLQTGMMARVSVDSNSVQADGFSSVPFISADGQYVVFESDATNLVPGDTNSVRDVFVHRQDILPIPPTPTTTFTLTSTPTFTPTATFTPTFTPTYTNTPTPTNTPMISPTAVTSCNQITAGPITKSGNSMSMAITSPLTVPIQIQDVFVAWNHDKGHATGLDKTLQLASVTLGSQLWSGTSNGPALTITPSPTTYIPSGTSTVTFTFHQSYDTFDETEQIIINLATNGCQSYPIVSTSTATSTPTNTFTPIATPPYSYNPLYLSLTGNQTIGGVVSADEDILRFDGSTWSLFFDGSDVGVGGSDLFGFSFLDADSLLLSFTTALTLNGISVTPQDVVRFDAASLGSTTSGVWSMYFDGSDVGFDTTAEKIDSVSLLSDGRVLLSTTGNPAVVGVTGAKDEDVLAFTPTTLGNATSGSWSMYFDGSDVGLAETSGEDVDALDVVGGKIYLSAADNFTVNGVAGADEDVFVCVPTSLGDVTACNYSPSLYFDGSTWGLTTNDVDAINLLASSTTPTDTPTNTPTRTPTATFTPTPTYTGTPTSTVTQTPTLGSPILPDLTIISMSITLQNTSCYTPGDPYGVRVWVRNDGQTAAGSFVVNVNGAAQTVNGLGVAETKAVFFPGASNPVTATVDSMNTVAESNENNNTRSEMLPVPTQPLPCPTPTFTPTYTPTPTALFTPTFTNTPSSSDLIFADGFESGNLSAWTSSSTDLGDLSVSNTAVLAGSQGLQAVVDDNNSIYLTDDSPNLEPRYRARFYFDPNAISMTSNDAHFIFKGFAGTSTDVLQVELRNSSGAYQIRAKVLNDSSAFVNTNWFTISDTPHVIELEWRAATAAGANNGGLSLWIDGTQQADLTNVDNDTWRIDRARLGAVAGVDTGTRGTYYFDSFESRRQNYIGP